MEKKYSKYYKKIVPAFLCVLFFTTSFAQRTQEFTEEFTTSSGIYGYVELLTKPATYGFANMQIQQRKVVVQGINTSGGNYSGNSLSEFGVSFPFECSNCYFYASGLVKMSIGYNGSSAKFKTSGSIHKNDYTIHAAKFSQDVLNLHNERLKKEGYSEWLKSGYTYNIDVSGVAGGDFGKITNAVQKLEKKLLNKKEFDKNIYAARSSYNKTNKERIAFLNKARKYAKTNAEINEVNKLFSEINQEIEKERIEKNEKKIKENYDKNKRDNAYKESEKTLEKTNNHNTNSYNDGMRQAQSYRDQANAIKPKYQYELDYKNDLLRSANELENNLIKPTTYIIPGSGETGQNQSSESFYTPTYSTSTQNNINSSLQSQGYSELAQGNYAQAVTTLSASGDQYGAIAAGAIGFFDVIFTALKDARDDKIRRRTKTLKSSLEKIDKSNKKLPDLYNQNDINEYTKLSFSIISDKIKALENGFHLIKSERSYKKGTYRKQMGKIWVSIFEQLDYSINNKYSSHQEKLDLLTSIPFLFKYNPKATKLYKAQVPNKVEINQAFTNIYKKYVAQNFHKFNDYEQLELFLMFPLDVSDFENIGLNMSKFKDYFQSLPSHLQEKVFQSTAIQHRIDIQKTTFINNSDLDNKILFLIENGLDYHFKVSKELTFEQLISSSLILKSKSKLHNLKLSHKLLKSKINQDKFTLKKSYDEITDEKYINRYLDTIASNNYNLDSIISSDPRFKVFKGLDMKKSRVIVLWKKNIIPSFKKVQLIENESTNYNIDSGNYLIIDHFTNNNLTYQMDAFSNIHKINAKLGEIYFIEINSLKGKKEFYINNISHKEGIRLLGKLKNLTPTDLEENN